MVLGVAVQVEWNWATQMTWYSRYAGHTRTTAVHV